ncbi:unnamed protein product [Ixodes pacificus]
MLLCMACALLACFMCTAVDLETWKLVTHYTQEIVSTFEHEHAQTYTSGGTL